MLSVTLRAFDVTPARLEFSSGANSSRQFFEVSNPKSAPLVLQVVPKRVAYTLDGVQVLTEVTNVFRIFPSKLVVPPGGRQRVRAEFLPSRPPASDELYRIVFKDLPVSVGPGGTNSGVKLTTEYQQLAIVRGNGTRGKVVVESAGPAQGTNAALAGKFEIVLHNEGNGFGRLTGLRTQVPFRGGSGSEAIRVTSQMVSNFPAFLILPGERRRLLFSMPSGSELSRIGSVEMEF